MQGFGNGDVPYWELSFGADGVVDARGRDDLLKGVRSGRIRDLIIFAHSWNNDRDTAISFDEQFLRPFCEAVDSGATAAAKRLGFVGVRWPAIRFLDESAPHLDSSTHEAAVSHRPGLDDATAGALAVTFPDRLDTVNALTDLLSEQPSPDADLDDLGLLLRRLVAVPLSGTRAAYATDTEGDLLPQSDPAMLFDEAAGVCGEFAVALGEAQNAARDAAHRPERQELFATEKDAAAPIPSSGTLTESETLGPRPAENPSRRLAGLGPVESASAFGAERSAKGYNRPWLGAHELVRQATGHAIRRSAGVVGAVGLAPVLDQVIEQRVDVRIHLVGHSHGARLVAFALDGLLTAAPAVSSMTLLQASFSHYAFARRMPQQTSGRGHCGEVTSVWLGQLCAVTRTTTWNWGSCIRWRHAWWGTRLRSSALTASGAP